MRGVAQSIRYLLAYVQIDYEDKVYDQGDSPEFSTEAWDSIKDTLDLDFPSLPYFKLEEDGVNLTGTIAILKYIVMKHEPTMLGKKPEEQGLVEMFAHVFTELMKHASVPCYVEGIEKSAIGDNLLKEFKPITKHLQDHSTHKFLVGNYLTYADFMLLEIIQRITWLTDGRLLSENAVLKQYY